MVDLLILKYVLSFYEKVDNPLIKAYVKIINLREKMERAEFIFQIFFDTFELNQKINNDFTIFIRLFNLPMIEIDRISGLPGVFELSTGKRLTLKMPYIEVLDECPLYIFIKTPRPGHTAERRCQHKVQLQNVFSHAIQNPGRYVQQRFVEIIKGRSDEKFGKMVFTVSTCYTSSTQEILTNLTPIIIHAQSSTESDLSLKGATKKKEMGTNTRVPLAPDPPETRSRSIFYFDKNELLEENRILAQEIKQLTDLVQRLKEVINSYQDEPSQNRQKKQRRTEPIQPARSDYIYHPPGLQTARRRPTTKTMYK
ncbi:hypothetical protein TRFO_07999 [Tritrichomonas foetus]|uniref:Uncharacterized protein n=1 Tax=Tritrichomonas foetus TaxID=1144522 RepID=A0A1J4JMN5_9EUKA|nr:hypothetical protein TRFO_07999 [Tritrichomonas foetus]|eukprot:OHT00331.1 hypothetical protein TRFO_07999 [Tritrichomonas foetus]